MAITSKNKQFLFVASRILVESKGKGRFEEYFVVTNYPNKEGLVRIHSLLTRRPQWATEEGLMYFAVGRLATAQDWTMASVEQASEEGPYLDGNDLFCDLVEHIPDFG